MSSIGVLPGGDEVVSHLCGNVVDCFELLSLTSGTWSILRYWWSVSSFHSGQGSRFMGLGFGPSVGIEIGNSGAVGFLLEQ